MNIHDSRLTAEDYDRIDARLSERLGDLQRRRPAYRPFAHEWKRLAHHAIGCSEGDLRGVELSLIGQQVETVCSHFRHTATPWPMGGEVRNLGGCGACGADITEYESMPDVWVDDDGSEECPGSSADDRHHPKAYRL